MSIRSRETLDRAHNIQSQAAIQGALRGTAIGLGSAVIAHHSWPLFRRQTLPFKAFLVSAFAIYGFVFGAENALLAHEAEERHKHNLLRQEARLDLVRQGIVPTEAEIAKWKRKEEYSR